MRWFSFQQKGKSIGMLRHILTNILEMCAFLSYIHKREMAAMACGGNTKHHPGERTRGLRAARHNILRCLLRIKGICKLKRREEGEKLVKYQWPSICISLLAHSPPSPTPLFLYHLNTISSCPFSILQNLHMDYDIEELKPLFPTCCQIFIKGKE